MTSACAMLALVTDAFGGRGGIAQYNRDFLSAVAGIGPEDVAGPSVTVLPRHTPDRAILPTGIRQTRPRPGRFAYSLMALAVALTRRVDLVFCGHLYMAPLAMLVARLKRAKLIIQTHGVEAWSRPLRLQRAALERADLVLCVSRHTRARVLDWAAVTPERVLVVPNTIGDAFMPGDGSSLRAALGLENKQILLTVGRMDSRERYKGHNCVIAAIPDLVAKGHDIAYVIIGEGDDLPRLETLANDAGVSERVHFLGAVEPQRLVEAYRMADLFVMPSTGEGFGIVFLEATVCGAVAVGLSEAGANDVLADGELGVATSEAELPATIARLLGGRKPDPSGLSKAVRQRFGRESFRACACAAVERLYEAT